MADYEDESNLVEATSGKWYRLAAGNRKGTFLIDLPNKVLLSVSVSLNNVEVFLPNEEGIYHRAGDVSFQLKDGIASIDLFSEALTEIQLERDRGTIQNTFSEITVVRNMLDLSQSKKWWTKNSIDF
ncbi:hypothetical protein LG275_03955 [Chryseomicrobium palamuruense]